MPGFCFNKNAAIFSVISPFGITYKEEQDIIERKILSISEKSKVRSGGCFVGEVITMKDNDVFDCQLKENKIQCVMDTDILYGEDGMLAMIEAVKNYKE